MATFTNQATLIYNGGATSSNVTTGELLDTLAMTKTAVSSTYARGDTVTYVVNVTNSGSTAITAATLTDDLGAFTADTVTVTPTSYVDGSIRYYRNGTLQTAPTVSAGPPLTVTGFTVPAGGNALLIYEVLVGDTAPLATGSTIVNTATLTATGISLTAEATVTVRDEVALTIAKAICPPTLNDNEELTYTFIIQNGGNTAVEAADNVIVTDTFNPILNPITAAFNDQAWTSGTEYDYDNTTGVFTTVAGNITVPAATYTTDTATGVISVTPGVAIITVTGTV